MISTTTTDISSTISTAFQTKNGNIFKNSTMRGTAVPLPFLLLPFLHGFFYHGTVLTSKKICIYTLYTNLNYSKT
jgi:hypothetical protein